MAIDVEAVDAVIEEASKPERFNVLDFVKGASLPVNEVGIRTDAEAAFELDKILTAEKEAADNVEDDGFSIVDTLPEIDETKVAEYKKRIEASTVIFKLRGLAPAASSAIEKAARAHNEYVEGTDNEAYNVEYNTTIIAKSIVGVYLKDGRYDDAPWDSARVQALADSIQPNEFQKLWTAAWDLSFTADLFDRVVNADF